MSKGQLSRTPDNFPRMKPRVVARRSRKLARAITSVLRTLDDEKCRPCVEGAGFMVGPAEDVPLCLGHWNRFINTYMESDGYGGLIINAPCDAHLIGGTP